MHRKRLAIQMLLVIILLSVVGGIGVWAQAGGGKVRFESVADENFPAMKGVVTVVDVNGTPLVNLDASNFSVFEDSKSVAVDVTENVNLAVPVSLLLVIDKSGSMSAKSTINPGKTKLDDAKDAAVRFLERLRPADRAGILAFGDAVDLNYGLDVDCVSDTTSKEHAFTDDKGALINCVNSLSTIANRVTTPLYDAAYKSVVEAAKEAAAQRNTPVVILFTDGKEGDAKGQQVSANPRVSAELAARAERIAIFTIGLGADADTAYLQALAQNTGGSFKQAPEAAQLDAIYNEIADRLRTQYILAWQSKIEPDAAPHQLDLKVETAGKEFANRVSFVAQKPVIPGIRFMHKRPTGLFNLGRETEVVSLGNGQEFRTNWTIVPDISARYDIDRVEYYLNDEIQSAFVAEAFPYNLPWAITRRAVNSTGEMYLVRAYAYDVEGHRGEASISLNVLPGGVDPTWLVLIVGLILLVAVVVLIFALRRQRQPVPVVEPPPVSGPIGSVLEPFERLPQPSAGAQLVVTGGPDEGRQFPLARPEIRIGRGSDNDICLEDPTVSRQHIAVRQEQGQYHLYDLGALNPAKVNGREVSQHRLEDGDQIAVGNTVLVFKLIHRS